MRRSSFPDRDLLGRTDGPQLIERLDHLRRRVKKTLGLGPVAGKPVDVTLHPGSVLRPLAADDVPLVVATRNEARLVPAFLAHYRRLGVTRFIVLDDVSTDGTTDILLAERDVDVWRSSSRYAEARRGRGWRERLFAIYGYDRWYLNVDIDEFLVYVGSDEGRDIPSLLKALSDRRRLRAAACMLDLYNPGPLEAAHLAPGGDPLTVATHFDVDGYRFTRKTHGLSLRGGVRGRLFGNDVELIKHPLLYWDASCSLGRSIHNPHPFDRNFGPLIGALLHFKIFEDVRARAQAAVSDSQYFDNAREYRRILEAGHLPTENLRCAGSRRYEGPSQLRDLGFITDLV